MREENRGHKQIPALPATVLTTSNCRLDPGLEAASGSPAVKGPKPVRPMTLRPAFMSFALLQITGQV